MSDASAGDVPSTSLPPSAVVEALFRRERLPWTLVGVTLGLVEGATVAVFVKRDYTGILPLAAVNLAVAVVSGASALANIVSFAWANLAHGRARVRLLVGLQAAFAVAVGMIALAPRAGAGLLLTVVAVIVARMLWAGVLTVRVAIWTANYPRQVMARVTGRIVVYIEVGMAAVALATGWVLDRRPALARWLYLLAALAGLAAAWRYRAVACAARDTASLSGIRTLHVLDEHVRFGQPDVGGAAGGVVHRSTAFVQHRSDLTAHRRAAAVDAGFLAMVGAAV